MWSAFVFPRRSTDTFFRNLLIRDQLQSDVKFIRRADNLLSVKDEADLRM